MSVGVSTSQKGTKSSNGNLNKRTKRRKSIHLKESLQRLLTDGNHQITQEILKICPETPSDSGDHAQAQKIEDLEYDHHNMINILGELNDFLQVLIKRKGARMTHKRDGWPPSDKGAFENMTPERKTQFLNSLLVAQSSSLKLHSQELERLKRNLSTVKGVQNILAYDDLIEEQNAKIHSIKLEIQKIKEEQKESQRQYDKKDNGSGVFSHEITHKFNDMQTIHFGTKKTKEGIQDLKERNSKAEEEVEKVSKEKEELVREAQLAGINVEESQAQMAYDRLLEKKKKAEENLRKLEDVENRMKKSKKIDLTPLVGANYSLNEKLDELGELISKQRENMNELSEFVKKNKEQIMDRTPKRHNESVSNRTGLTSEGNLSNTKVMNSQPELRPKQKRMLGAITGNRSQKALNGKGRNGSEGKLFPSSAKSKQMDLSLNMQRLSNEYFPEFKHVKGKKK